jgi:ABC-type glycerol-3-phosphate transport system substrate-binding protein
MRHLMALLMLAVLLAAAGCSGSASKPVTTEIFGAGATAKSHHGAVAPEIPPAPPK